MYQSFTQRSESVSRVTDNPLPTEDGGGGRVQSKPWMSQHVPDLPLMDCGALEEIQLVESVGS